MTRSEVIERLRHLSDVGVNCQDDVALILQAANLLEAGEARTAYRVVGDAGRLALSMPVYKADAEWVAIQAARNGYTNVRIQSRQVTESPWTDLDEGAPLPGEEQC